MSAKAAGPRQRLAVCVVAGKNRFLVETEVSKLLDEIIPSPDRDMALFCPDPDIADIADVLDELRMPGLLTPNKVVLLRQADDFISKNRESLEHYFEKPSPSGTLILTVSSWPRTTKLAKKLPDIGRLITAAEIKSSQMPDFVIQYASRTHNKTIARAAACALIELVGEEPGILAAEVDKLATLAEAGKNITVEDVRSVASSSRLFDVFEVISAMTAGDAATAMKRLRNMFSNDKNAEYTAVGAFAWHFRRLFQAKAALASGASRNDVAEKLRIWNDREGFFALLQNLSLSDIGSILRRLAAIDHSAKTGGGTAEVAIEQLVAAICAKQTAPAAGKRR